MKAIQLPFESRPKQSPFVARLVLAILAGGMVLGGWSGEASPPSFRIIMESRSPYYEPPLARVNTGFPIRWENPTATFHTVTHEECLVGGSCIFDSGAVAPGANYTLPGLPPGQYPYQCRLHPIMRGVITVEDATALPSET
jgi:plastocyanin